MKCTIDLSDSPVSSWETIVNESGPLADDDGLVAKQRGHDVIYLCTRVTAPRLNPKNDEKLCLCGLHKPFQEG